MSHLADTVTLQERASEIASEIHETYKRSYWTQKLLIQEIVRELERLDNEYQESQEP